MSSRPLLLLAALLVGCSFVPVGDGADAGPLDAGPPDAGPPDAGPPDAGPPDAGRADAGPPDAGRPDAGRPFNIFDLLPPDAGLEECERCLRTGGCGNTINGCVNDPVCVDGLGCTIERCFLDTGSGDGGPPLMRDGGVDIFSCALGCFNNNLFATLRAVGAFTCLTTCTTVCAGDLLDPFFGGDGGRPDGGRPDGGRPDAGGSDGGGG